MIFLCLLALGVAKQGQSFLQQDEVQYEEFWQETQADYDRKKYNGYPEELDKYEMEGYEPEGKSTPENDYLFVQYETYINELYDIYYVDSTQNDYDSSEGSFEESDDYYS
jgi:hypothetical protein